MAGIRDAYKRCYKMRALGQNGLNIVVSIPRVVIQREAEKRSLTIGEFLEQFKAIAQYDNFEGIIYTFEETKRNCPSQAKREETDSGK